MKKLAQIAELLAAVRTLLDGGYHYSSPFIRSRGDSDDSPPPMIREKADGLSLLSDIVSDLQNVALSLDNLDDQAKDLKLNTIAICGVDLALYTRVYDQLATDIKAAMQTAIDGLANNGESVAKPERRKPGRTPKSTSTSKQTMLNVIDPALSTEGLDHEATQDRATVPTAGLPESGCE